MPDDMTPSERRRFNWLVVIPLDSAQRNVLRAEALKTCRDIIDVFFQFRLKAEEASRMQAAANPMTGAEMKALASRFGAYGTFLANFQDEDARYRYTVLARELSSIAEAAGGMAIGDFTPRFAKAEEAFGKLNDDCAKAAQSRLL
jgi:hypothetical protein